MVEKKNIKSVSRRGFIPLLTASIFFPLFSQSAPLKQVNPKEDDEYATLLTPDGDVVKVKRSALKKVKVIEKKMSNKSLLNWLKPKDGNKPGKL